MASPIIKVRYLGATNHRGARFIASAFNGLKTMRATVAYDNGDVNNGRIAADKLAEKLTADNPYYTVTVGADEFYDEKSAYFGTVFTNKTEA